MHRFAHIVRQIASHEIEQRTSASLGVVKSVQADDGYSCTVALRDSGIVLPKVPIAVQLLGQAALPNERDLVIVLFVGGDLQEPVVVGRLYSEAVAAPTHGAGELVVALPASETDSEKRLELRVKTPGDGSRTLHLVLDGPVKVELEVNDSGLKLQAQDTSLTLTQSGSSDGQAELRVGQCKLTLQQGGDVSIETSGKLTLKGATVEIDGDTSVKIAGQTIDLN